MLRRTFGGASAADWMTAALILGAALTLFGWRIAIPDNLVFDETHYVPAGKAFFQLEGWTNKSHPPFAKWLIGLSISIFGDNSFAWRLPSAIFGSLTVFSVFAVMRLFGFTIGQGVAAAFLTLVNQTLFVQARVGMLDAPALGLFALSVLCFVWAGKRIRSRNGAMLGLILSGVFLGLGAATKWTTGINMILIWMGVAIWRFSESSPNGVFLPRIFGAGFAGWRHFSFVGAGLRQGLPALAVYALTFAPFILMQGQWSIIDLHLGMFNDVAGDLAPHDHQSRWWQWPFIGEPIWYHFADAPGRQTGDERLWDTAIFYVGNPVVYWAGIPAVLACIAIGLKRADGAMLAASGAYLAFWLVWAIIPRELTFAFYFEPSAAILGMCITIMIARILPVKMQSMALILWCLAAGLMFAYFYPVLSGEVLAKDEWLRWVWFKFWLQ